MGEGVIGSRLFRKIVKANKLEKMERVAKKGTGDVPCKSAGGENDKIKRIPVVEGSVKGV